MTALYIVLGIVLLLVGIIFFSVLKLSCRFFADKDGVLFQADIHYLNLTYRLDRKNSQAKKTIVISIFGFKIRHKIKEKSSQKEKPKTEETPTKQSEEDTFTSLKNGVDAFLKVKDNVFEALRYFSDKLVFEKLKNRIEIGWDDAAYTAISTGL